MTEPWAQSYENLHPTARAILRGLAVLDLPTIATTDLAGLAIDDQDASSALTELVSNGWIVALGTKRWTILPETSHRLAHVAGLAEPSRAAVVVHRFADHLTEQLQASNDRHTPVDADRGAKIVATIRAAGRHGLVDVGAELAITAWRGVRTIPDFGWWRSLAEAGEDLATEGRAPEHLVELLYESGTAFAHAGDSHIADRQWRRAFAVTEQLGDRKRSAELLRLIAGQRRTTGSLGRALTVYHELIELCEDEGDQLGLAEALAELAVTLLMADRSADVVHFLQRADEVLSSVDDLPGQGARRHAGTLVTLGRCWDQLDVPGSAMSCYSQALAELIDVDDQAADEARHLLAAAKERAGA